jgi:pimeloyl-ACP methyl ester carboxylesterase
MTGWHSGSVEVKGLRLHFTRTGGDKPPLVLAHGVTDDGLCWTPVAAALAPEFDVVMVDARGHGRSDPAADGYALTSLADDLAALVEALGLRQPAILGHSLGAATALGLAGARPELPGSILLEDPPAWWTARATTAVAGERATELRGRASRLRAMKRDELIAEQRLSQPGWSEAELEPWAAAKQWFDPNVTQVFDPAYAADVDWPMLLRRITCPALLLTGDSALGAIVSADDADALRELVPQLAVAHVPAAGHSIRRDQFAAYLESVRAFLAAPRSTR